MSRHRQRPTVPPKIGSRAINEGYPLRTDPRLLHASIDRFMGQKLRSRTLERLDEYNRNPTLQQQGQADGQTGRDVKVLDPRDAERGHYARATLGTLRSLADFMGSIRGRRKAILMFSKKRGHRLSDPRRLRLARRLDDHERHA